MDTSNFNIVPPPPDFEQGIDLEGEPASHNQYTIFNVNLQVTAIVWTVVNIVLALLMVARITYFSIEHRAVPHSRGDGTGLRASLLAKLFKDQERIPWVSYKITMEDMFPFLLAITIAVQGIIFLYGEMRDIGDGVEMMMGCKAASKIAWAGIWMMPVLVLVFSLECLIRSFAQTNFPPRRSITTIFCICCTVALTALTCIFLRPEAPDNDLCDGNLLHSVNQYGLGGLGLAGAFIPIWAFILIGIWFNVKSSTDIPVEQRIEVIKIGAYTILAALQMAFVIPYFATATLNSVNKAALIIAEVALNIMGLVCFIAQYFLDSYAHNLIKSSQTAGDPEKATPGPNGPPQESFGGDIESTPTPQEETAGTIIDTNIPNSIGPTSSQKPSTSLLTSLPIQLIQLGQKFVTVMSKTKEPARSTSPCVPNQQAYPESQTSFTSLHLARTPTTDQPRPLPLPLSPQSQTPPRKPRPLPPVPQPGFAINPAPARPSRSEVPALHLEDLAVRAVIMGPVPPRVIRKKTSARTLTPILERPVPPPMEVAQAPAWATPKRRYQVNVQGKLVRV